LRWRRLAFKAGRWLTLAVAVATALAPIYWLTNLATHSQSDIVSGRPSLLLGLGSLGGITHPPNDIPLMSWLRNSLVVGVGTAILSVGLAVLAGFGLSRFRFRGAGVFGFLVFFTQMLPSALLVIPLYSMLLTFNLLNNLGSLVLVDSAFAMPICVWIIKGGMDSIPRELDEAVRLDGAGSFGLLRRVILPLVAPSLAAAAVVAFLAGWNDFLFANTFITSENLWTTTKGLASLYGQYTTPIPLIMATALLFCLPPVGFFMLMQRRIVAGLTAGAVKG
jgi:multiple sugar transport system permease protein